MSKLSQFWDWLLPGLICLSPMGADAYFNAGAEKEAPNHDSEKAGRSARVSKPLIGGVVISVARR